MKKLNKTLLIIAIIFTGFINQAWAADNYIPVRVGISDTKFKNYLFDSIEFNNANELYIMDSATGYSLQYLYDANTIKVVMSNGLFKIYTDGKLTAENLEGPVFIRPKDNCFISIKDLKRKGKQALYRGYIELKKSTKNPEKFAIVNVLSLKKYLQGVVPNEMPVRFGLEALKAQTVAARNYAVTPRVKAYEEFDLCDSVACQVYFGANTEDELSDRAIEETNGILALDKENNPILALYSSTAGGYTESYEYAFSDPKTKIFPSMHLDYMIATPDNKEFPPLNAEEKAYEFYTSTPEAFDDVSPYYRWTKEWSLAELEQVLSKTLVTQSKTGFITPQLTDEKDFGKLEEINVLERGNSGKIITLEIKTDKNTFIVQKELVIRRCFQKNGISLPSANFVITKTFENEKPVYKFFGGGFGHGVGLSQWGAGKMASLGFTFDEILQHYYNGIKLATISVKIRGNNQFTDQIFYTSNEDAKIVNKNPDKIKKIQIVVNKKELNIKLKENQTVVDISKYLEKGVNKISYKITDEDADYTKSILASVIVKEAKHD